MRGKAAKQAKTSPEGMLPGIIRDCYAFFFMATIAVAAPSGTVSAAGKRVNTVANASMLARIFLFTFSP